MRMIDGIWNGMEWNMHFNLFRCTLSQVSRRNETVFARKTEKGTAMRFRWLGSIEWVQFGLDDNRVSQSCQTLQAELEIPMKSRQQHAERNDREID